MASKLVTVYGATGRQGGSVARSLLQNASRAFTVRGTTRNTSSEKALALKELGVEMVTVDTMTDYATQARSAFEGSWGAFININSYDPILTADDGPSVYEFGKGIVDAAAAAGVERVVYSTMPNASQISDGLVSIEFFDEKAALGDYIRSNPSFKSVSLISPGWYMENFLNKEFAPILGGFPYFNANQLPGGNESDSETVTLRMASFGGSGHIHLLSVDQDYGDLVHAAFIDPKAAARAGDLPVQGISIPATPESVVEAFQEATKKAAKYEAISLKQFETNGVKGLLALKKEMFYCQYSGGQFFGEPLDTTVAAKLKAIAVVARRRPESEAVRPG